MKKKNNTLGFTLLELLIVVLIIALLAGIALPQYKKVVIKSRFAEVVNTLHILMDAQNRYYIVNGTYANKRDYLDVDFPLSETYFKNTKYQIKVSKSVHCGLEGAPHNVYCSTSRISLMYLFPYNHFVCCNYQLDNYEIDKLCKQFVQKENENGGYSTSSRRCYSGKGHDI